jgi:hypothetical protein
MLRHGDIVMHYLTNRKCLGDNDILMKQRLLQGAHSSCLGICMLTLYNYKEIFTHVDQKIISTQDRLALSTPASHKTSP